MGLVALEAQDTLLGVSGLCHLLIMPLDVSETKRVKLIWGLTGEDGAGRGLR